MINIDRIKALVAEWRHVISPELSVRTPEAVGSNMADQLEALLAAYVAGQDALRPFALMTEVLETRAKLTFGRALKDSDVLFESSGEAGEAILTVAHFRAAALATKED